MKFLFYTLFFSAMLAGCNADDDGNKALLNEPAYHALTDSIRQQPQNPELYYKRGALLLQNNQMNFAEADLKKAYSLKKEEQYALGIVNVLRRKNTDSAIVFIQEASKELPQSIALRISLARGYQQKGDLTAATVVCNEIIAEFPNQLDALLLKAEILQQQKKGAEALATLETAYTYAPFDAELVHNLAFQYAEARNPKVLKLCDSLIRADVTGKHAEPYYFKGVYYANLNNLKQAISFFNEAIQHDYYFLDAYMDKGNLQFDNGQYKEALITFELATTVSPTFAEAYYWLGKTKEVLGDKSEAKLDYQRAYGLDKTLTEAKAAADKL